MSLGDKNQIIRGLGGDSISREWVDPLLQMSRQKVVEEGKLVRLHQDSSKILGLLGLKSSIIPFPETGTNLDVLHEELEQIQVEVFKLQAAHGVVTKLLRTEVIKGIRKDLEEEEEDCWVIPSDKELNGEAATAERASSSETRLKGKGNEEGGGLNTGGAQSPSVDARREDDDEVKGDIGSLTTAQEDQRILYQHSILRNVVPLVEGKSLEGKTLPELSTGIPTPTSLVISIANYMDVTLEQPAIFHMVQVNQAAASSALAGQSAQYQTSYPSSIPGPPAANQTSYSSSVPGQAANYGTSYSNYFPGQPANYGTSYSTLIPGQVAYPPSFFPSFPAGQATNLTTTLPPPLSGPPNLQSSAVSGSSSSFTVGTLTNVQPRSIEVARVQARTPRQVGDKISGILGYKIPNTDRKLFINFEVTQTGATFIGLSLGPDHLTVGEDARYYIWYQTDYNSFRPDTRRNGQKGLGGQLVVSNENLRAWGEISGGTKAIIKVAIWSENGVTGLVREWKPKWDEIATLIGPVRRPFACRLVLGNDNLLKVDLLEDDLMLKSGMTQADISSLLRPSEKESLLVSGAKSAEGLLLYKIGQTDIKLAVAFWISPTNCSFAISFVGAESRCNDEFLKSLSTNLKNWTRSTFKLASPSDGEQQIQIRNLVAKAVMSNAHGASNLSCRSLLKVSVQVQNPLSAEYCSEHLY